MIITILRKLLNVDRPKELRYLDQNGNPLSYGEMHFFSTRTGITNYPSIKLDKDGKSDYLLDFTAMEPTRADLIDRNGVMIWTKELDVMKEDKQ